MSNFTSANPNIDAALSACGQYGNMNRFIAFHLLAVTAATTTSGLVNTFRCPSPLTIPTVGTGVQGYCLTMNDIAFSGNAFIATVLEYSLGVLTLNGNVFSGSATMPTKTVLGTSLQTASMMAFLAVTTTGTATTPIITITYTDQDGNTNQTATMTLPTTPLANSAFLINPHLANGDSGIRSITGMSSSVTTGALVLNVYGCLIIGESNSGGTGVPHGSVEPAISPTKPMFNCAANDIVNFYAMATSAAVKDIYACLSFTPEIT